MIDVPMVHMCGREVEKLRRGGLLLFAWVLAAWPCTGTRYLALSGSQRVYNRRRVQALVCPSTVDSFEYVHTETSPGTREGEGDMHDGFI